MTKIALIGAKYTGTSNYIGVLVNEIQKRMVAQFNCIFSKRTSKESAIFYDSHYYDPLYRRGRVVPFGSSGFVESMIFPLRFLTRRNRIKRTACITFHEDNDLFPYWYDDEETRLLDSYLSNANGIIFLLDPLQVPAIREKLKGRMKLPPQSTEAIELLENIVKVIRGVKNISARKQINIPIALVFTKIDALYEHDDILPADSVLREESQHVARGVFVDSDRQEVELEIMGLLGEWIDTELQPYLHNFSNYAFFGVSALGNEPVGGNVPNGIQSKRVLDPVLWLLAEQKLIKKVKK